MIATFLSSYLSLDSVQRESIMDSSDFVYIPCLLSGRDGRCTCVFNVHVHVSNNNLLIMYMYFFRFHYLVSCPLIVPILSTGLG